MDSAISTTVYNGIPRGLSIPLNGFISPEGHVLSTYSINTLSIPLNGFSVEMPYMRERPPCLSIPLNGFPRAGPPGTRA